MPHTMFKVVQYIRGGARVIFMYAIRAGANLSTAKLHTTATYQQVGNCQVAPQPMYQQVGNCHVTPAPHRAYAVNCQVAYAPCNNLSTAKLYSYPLCVQPVNCQHVATTPMDISCQLPTLHDPRIRHMFATSACICTAAYTPFGIHDGCMRSVRVTATYAHWPPTMFASSLDARAVYHYTYVTVYTHIYLINHRPHRVNCHAPRRTIAVAHIRVMWLSTCDPRILHAV